MKTHRVGFAIEGTGLATIEAETLADTQRMLNAWEFSTDPEIHDWEINKLAHRGGYLELNE